MGRPRQVYCGGITQYSKSRRLGCYAALCSAMVQILGRFLKKRRPLVAIKAIPQDFLDRHTPSMPLLGSIPSIRTSLKYFQGGPSAFTRCSVVLSSGYGGSSKACIWFNEPPGFAEWVVKPGEVRPVERVLCHQPAFFSSCAFFAALFSALTCRRTTKRSRMSKSRKIPTTTRLPPR